jgi:hypothetical protein
MSGLTRLLTLMAPVMLVTIGFSQLDEATIANMNEFMSLTAYAMGGSIFGIFYFMISEIGLENDNRSYVANPLTDVLAFMGTGWLILRAYELGEGLLVTVGCAIFVIHVLQLAFKQGFNFESPGSGFWR